MKKKFKMSQCKKKWKVTKKECGIMNDFLDKNIIGKSDVRKSLILLRLMNGNTTKAKWIWGGRKFIDNLIKANIYEKETKLIKVDNPDNITSIDFCLLLSGGKGFIKLVEEKDPLDEIFVKSHKIKSGFGGED